MRNPLIDQYIERYFDKWSEHAVYEARYLMISNEAHEILMNSMEAILSKPDGDLLKMIDCDRKGGHYFYNFVKVIHFQALQVKNKIRIFYCVDACQIKEPNDDTIWDNIEPRVREVESMFRDDHFIDPGHSLEQNEKIVPICKVHLWTRAMKRKTKNPYPWVGYRVEYATNTKKRVVKNFRHRGEAVQWVIQNSI